MSKRASRERGFEEYSDNNIFVLCQSSTNSKEVKHHRFEKLKFKKKIELKKIVVSNLEDITEWGINIYQIIKKMYEKYSNMRAIWA